MMNRSDLLLGIDIGTQGVKGALVDSEGRIIAQHHIEHGSTYPRPDWCEQDMVQNWWKNPLIVVRKLLNTLDVLPEQVKIVSTSGLYPALGPTDAQGNPIAPAILYSDNRSTAEVYEINEALDLQLSGEELTPKLVWFLRHEPELARLMKMFFDAPHYFVYKLCGEYVTDTVTTGLYGAIYQSPSASWRESICERFGIPVEILPRVYPPATIVGSVHHAAAEATGLAVGTPVLTGMPDLLASLISVGAVYRHESAAYYGTAGLLPVMKDDLISAAFNPYPHEERGKTAQDGYIFDYPAYCLTVGDAVRWFRDEFGQTELGRQTKGEAPDAYVQLDNLADSVPPGSEGVVLLPYLLGQRSPDFNPYASGVFFGIKKAHTRGHLYRAVLESFGFTIRHGLESFYPGGHSLTRLVATGGGARSSLWRQIVSDITGLSQEYIPDSDGPLGCAYMGGLGLGWFTDFEVLQHQWVKIAGTTRPDPNSKELYDQVYQTYVELHDALKPIFIKN